MRSIKLLIAGQARLIQLEDEHLAAPHSLRISKRVGQACLHHFSLRISAWRPRQVENKQVGCAGVPASFS